MTLKLAAVQHFCARVADAFLTSISPLTYERGDYQDLTEAEDPDWEQCNSCGSHYRGGHTCIVTNPCGSCSHDPALHYSAFDPRLISPCNARDCSCAEFIPPSPSRIASPVCGEGPTGVCDIPPSPPVGCQLPMFNAADLESIARRYLVWHFPWPDEGLFACTCGTKGFTIAAWSAHVGELQISELVFELQSLVYEQNNHQEQP